MYVQIHWNETSEIINDWIVQKSKLILSSYSILRSPSFSKRYRFHIDGKLPKMEGKKKKNPDQDLTIRFYRQFAKHFRLFPWILAKGYSGRFGGAPLKRRGHFFPPQIMRNRGTAIVWKTFRLKSDLLARRNFFFLPPPPPFFPFFLFFAE